MHWWTSLEAHNQIWLLSSMLTGMVFGVVLHWMISRWTFRKQERRHHEVTADLERTQLSLEDCQKDKGLLLADLQKIKRQHQDLKAIYQQHQEKLATTVKQLNSLQQAHNRLEVKCTGHLETIETLNTQILGLKTRLQPGNSQLVQEEVQLHQLMNRLEQLVHQLDNQTTLKN